MCDVHEAVGGAASLTMLLCVLLSVRCAEITSRSGWPTSTLNLWPSDDEIHVIVVYLILVSTAAWS